MKLKHIYSLLFIALLGFMTSCNDNDSITLLDEIQVSSSYVSISKGGGSASITVTSKDSWQLEKSDKFAWLNVSANSGGAGETTITLSADETIDGRSAEIKLISGKATQYINIIQGILEATEVTIAEALVADDGRYLRVRGICTNISNTEYGNWDIVDETGKIAVYGTLDAKGNSKNFKSLDIEEGDELVIEGPKGTHQGNPQLVDVIVIKLNKTLITVDSVDNAVLPLNGGIFSAHLTIKGEGLSVDIPEDAKDWLTIESIKSSSAMVSTVNFKAAVNDSGDPRKTTITFRTKDSKGNEYSIKTVLEQNGPLTDVNIAQFLEADLGEARYRMTGVVSRLANAKYGGLDLTDYSDKVYTHNLADYKEGDIKAGDIITMISKRGEHAGAPQAVNSVLEKVKSVTPISIEDVITKPDSEEDYYMITGKITKIESDFYGNFDFNSGETKLYVRGLFSGYGAQGDDYTRNVIVNKEIKVGDQITVISTKGSYGESAQLNNAIYFSHESQAEE